VAKTEVTLYDFLEALLDRTAVGETEEEVRLYRDLMRKLREVNLFGVLAERTKVKADPARGTTATRRY
jgi:hypothetical protein